jgi:hypothetical protein
MEVLKQIIKYIGECEKVAESDMAWKDKYVAIERIYSEHLKGLLDSANLSIDLNPPTGKAANDAKAILKGLAKVKADSELGLAF